MCVREFSKPRVIARHSCPIYWAALLSLRAHHVFCHCEPRLVGAWQSHWLHEIAAHLSGAHNDSGKQPDESGDYKNLEVKYEDNT